MNLDFSRTQKMLKTFDFNSLFREELGWEPQRYDITVTVDGQNYALQMIAHKRGFAALWLKGQIPTYALRRKIDAQVAKSYHEHLVIYTDAGQTTQVWQWIKKEAGRPAASRETTYRVDSSGAALIQKLEYLAVTLDDEERLTILDVAERVKTGFDVERVTKKFYERFKDEHAAFLKFIAGIPDEGLQRWYVSVTLNRLMFVYFIQKKGFLDGNLDYLRGKLAESQKKGPDSFYSDFLCPLFFKGFAAKKQDAETVRLLGKVPYLNGGIFAKHQIEQRYGQKIVIPDAAFERLFAFFEQYQWHLDERPLRKDNEINPDVLGYIFEKYINQKQMGAYYTKEDITEYISKNTIIPFLFDAARKACTIAFEKNSAVWKLLQANPDRYIYAAVRHGLELALPEEIASGLDAPGRRQGWNKSAPSEYALPTETWREVVARRQKYTEARRQMESGEVHEINSLITLNLNVRQFAQDVIENAEGVDLLRAFWKTILSLTLLDPTVGSGAFLFAAMNVMEPLYEACLERMQVFVDELDRSGEAHRPEKFSDFRKVLAEIERHPNRRYYILKSIMVNNLYGVDIMDEAVEICKLRLFLKLVAQVEQVDQVEPLPDIDFNIRAGNTLVGFATREDVHRAVQMGKSTGGAQQIQTDKLFAMPEEETQLLRIEEKAGDVERLFKLFRQQQTELGSEADPEAKDELKRRLKVLDDELNVLLARQYAIHNPKSGAFTKWLISHQPFHWFVEFYGIMRGGGFDVIIGNPPYVEISEVSEDYSIQNNNLVSTGNLYSACMERFAGLNQKSGYCGVIVPISSVSTPRMLPLMQFLEKEFKLLYLSNYAVRPGKLFVGADMNLTIIIGKKNAPTNKIFSTDYQRWNEDNRQYLFETLSYGPTKLDDKFSAFPKIGNTQGFDILKKILAFPSVSRFRYVESLGETVYYHSGGRYFRKCIRQRLSNEYKPLTVLPKLSDMVICLLSSSLYYWLWIVFSDCYHVTRGDIDVLPVPDSLTSEDKLHNLAKILLIDLEKNAITRVRNRKDGTTVQEVNYQVRPSKPIIDEIDRALAHHYGLTAEELDFIINFDVKYRLGAGAGDDADE
ncbi:MAG: DNA methyltransferase [Chloroflexota bacterium]